MAKEKGKKNSKRENSEYGVNNNNILNGGREVMDDGDDRRNAIIKSYAGLYAEQRCCCRCCW